MREAIILLIESSIDLRDSFVKSLEHYDKYQNLKSQGHRDILERELNHLYKEVEITGFGKRGIVKLGEERKQPLKPTVDGRKKNKGGRSATIFEKDFHFQMLNNITSLLNSKKNNYYWTNISFADDLGVDREEDIDPKHMKNIMKSLYDIFGLGLEKYTSEDLIKFELVHTLRQHTNSVIKSGLNFLKQNNYITIQEGHTITNGNRYFRQLSDEEVFDFYQLEEEILDILGHEKWYLLTFRYSNAIPTNSKSGQSLAHDFLKYKETLTAMFGGHIMFNTFRPTLTTKGMTGEKFKDTPIKTKNNVLYWERTLSNRMPKRKTSNIFNKRFFHILLHLWMREHEPHIAEMNEDKFLKLVEDAKEDFKVFEDNYDYFDEKTMDYSEQSAAMINAYYRGIWNTHKENNDRKMTKNIYRQAIQDSVQKKLPTLF